MDMSFQQWSERRKGAFSALLSLDEFIDSYSEGLAFNKVMTNKQQTFVRSLLKWCIDNLDGFLETGGMCQDFNFYIKEGELNVKLDSRKRDLEHISYLHTKDILAAICNDDYNFLSRRTELGNNIALLCVAGSHSYGMNVDDSDIDIRGMATNSKMRLFTNNMFDSYVDAKTDTTIYSFEKLVSLLCANNPNVIEILGLKPEHYLYVNEVGRMLLDRKDIFLSKRIVKPIQGIVDGFLKKIDSNIESIESSILWQQRGLTPFQSLYPDDYKMRCKVCAHIIRLYAMGCEILDSGVVQTYREKEHDLLADIRSGKYLDSNGHPTMEYNDLRSDYLMRFNKCAAKTSLPAMPDKKKVEKLMYDVNDYVCSNEQNHSDTELSFTAWRNEIGKETKGEA